MPIIKRIYLWSFTLAIQVYYTYTHVKNYCGDIKPIQERTGYDRFFTASTLVDLWVGHPVPRTTFYDANGDGQGPFRPDTFLQ